MGCLVARAAELVPKHEWAERLEQVRGGATPRTFAGFVKAVCRTTGEFPVPSARTWHTARQPPPDYLEAVVQAFGVSAHWLLTGAGEPFDPRAAVGVVEPKAEPEALWMTVLRVLLARGHTWVVEGTAMVTVVASVYWFTVGYLESRGEEPTLSRVVEVMDEHFFMLREGYSSPVIDKAALIAGLYSSLAAAWLQQIEED